MMKENRNGKQIPFTIHLCSVNVPSLRECLSDFGRKVRPNVTPSRREPVRLES